MRMHRTGKYVMAAALAVLLSVTGAGAASALQPGCDGAGDGGGFWGVLKNRAEAQRVRDRGYTRIIKPNDSALATTCFDQALALSSRLGLIFSDKAAVSVRPPNFTAFLRGAAPTPDNVYNMYAGLGVNAMGQSNTLANAYASVVGGTLNAYLNGGGNFDNTISQAMGATVTGALASYTGTVDGFMGGLQSAMSGVLDFTNAASSVSNFSVDFSASVGFLGDLQFSFAGSLQVIAEVGTYVNMMADVVAQAQGIAAQLNAAGGLVSNFSAGFADLAGGIAGTAQASMTGMDWAAVAAGGTPPPGGGCAVLDAMWNGNPALGVSGVEGGGPEMATTMPVAVSGSMMAGVSGGAGFMATMSSVGNSAILAAAQADVTGRLSAPGSGLASWKPAPVIAPGASTADIILMMGE